MSLLLFVIAGIISLTANAKQCETIFKKNKHTNLGLLQIFPTDKIITDLSSESFPENRKMSYLAISRVFKYVLSRNPLNWSFVGNAESRKLDSIDLSELSQRLRGRYIVAVVDGVQLKSLKSTGTGPEVFVVSEIVAGQVVKFSEARQSLLFEPIIGVAKEIKLSYFHEVHLLNQ